MRLTRRVVLVGAAGAAAGLSGLRSPRASAAATDPTAPVVDLHAHALTASYLEAIDATALPPLLGTTAVPDWSPELALAHMDRVGVDRQVLSLPDPALRLVPRSQRRHVATAVNDELAHVVASAHGRFAALAVLPLGDQVATLREIRRVHRLGMPGVILPTNVDGRYLGEPAFELAMLELNRLGMLALIHAAPPAPGDAPADLELPPGLLDASFEPVRATASLLYSLTLARYPRIRFVLGDGGGAVPYLWYRVAVFTGRAALSNLLQRPTTLGPLDLTRSLQRMRVDSAGATDPANIAAIRASVGVDRLVLGTDWPIAADDGGALDPLRRALTAQEAEHVLRGSALR